MFGKKSGRERGDLCVAPSGSSNLWSISCVCRCLCSCSSACVSLCVLRVAGPGGGLQERGAGGYAGQFLGSGVCGVSGHGVSVSAAVAVRLRATCG